MPSSRSSRSMNIGLISDRNGGLVLMSSGISTPLTWYWNCGPSVLRMWICWFWSMATPGIRARTSESGAVGPPGLAAMSWLPAVYWLAPLGETAGPARELASTTTVLSSLPGAPVSARAPGADRHAASTAA